MKLLLPLLMLVVGCLPEQTPIFTSKKWLFSVYAKDHVISTAVDDINKFTENLDAYMDAVMPRLAATGLLDPDVTVPGNEFVERMSVQISTQISARGLYAINGNVILRPESKTLSVFGHELVRHLLYMSGERGAAQNSSLDWSGDVGILWNIAETSSLEFLGAP